MIGFLKHLYNKLTGKKYFLNFVGYGIFNEKYWHCTAGRIEILVDDQPYAIDELSYFTDKTEEMYDFREKWDFKYVDKKILNDIKEKVEKDFKLQTTNED
jgi:hypothetical protein